MKTPAADLPADLSSFVGRADQIAQLRCLVEAQRLVTLTGAGGCGKTRMALACGRALTPSFGGRVWFVELASLADPALVARAVAAALCVQGEPGAALRDALVAALMSHPALLVLDNCEHLVGGCADLVGALLVSCPQLRILTTSRAALGVAGEIVWAVPPLSFPPADTPDAPADLLQYQAVRLFIERAGAAGVEFEADIGDLPAIGEICRRLDGLPLAIELAAARTRVLSVQQIAARLDACLRLLAAGSRTAPLRQQTLEATQDWSYRLLSEKARAAFRRLAVFAGSWSLEAAEAVCAGADLGAEEILDLLDDLANQSLIVVERRQGEARYAMLEVVRQYAHRRLTQSGEQREAQDLHLAFFAQLAERARSQLTAASQAAWFARIELDLGNLCAAMDWSLEGAAPARIDLVRYALRLPADLERFWSPRGYSAEGAERLRRALALPGACDPAVAIDRAHALNAAGVLSWFHGQYAAARRFTEEALAIGEARQHQQTILEALRNRGTAAVLQNDLAAGVPLLERSLALGRAQGSESRHSVAWALGVLGSARYLQGDDEQAAGLFEESAALLRELGDASFLALALRRMGQIELRRRNPDRAGRLLRESFLLNSGIGSPGGMAADIAGLAGALCAKGRLADAAGLLGVAHALLTEMTDQPTIIDTDVLHAFQTHIRDRVGAEAFAAARAAGRRVRGVEAIRRAVERGLAALAPHEAGALAGAPLRDDAGLTVREREVAALVAHGHSNREIARILCVEIKTVEAHLTRIRAKLDASSRVHIAAWAIARGLAALPQPPAL